jgi:hypothetical protein
MRYYLNDFPNFRPNGKFHKKKIKFLSFLYKYYKEINLYLYKDKMSKFVKSSLTILKPLLGGFFITGAISYIMIKNDMVNVNNIISPEEIMKLAKNEASNIDAKKDYTKSQLYNLTLDGKEDLLKSELGRKIITEHYNRYIERVETLKKIFNE